MTWNLLRLSSVSTVLMVGDFGKHVVSYDLCNHDFATLMVLEKPVTVLQGGGVLDVRTGFPCNAVGYLRGEHKRSRFSEAGFLAVPGQNSIDQPALTSTNVD